MHQATNSILMIRPVNFRMNEQTAVNNYYQKVLKDLLPATVNQKAQQEFDAFVEKLRGFGVEVVVVSDTKELDTPDSIFPNNWVSFHADATVALYPMFAENRRLERREDVLEELEKNGFLIENIVDYTSAEDEQVYLEGTGSMILDRENKKAYCAFSPRADEDLFIEFCEDFEYTPVVFTSYQTVDNKSERKNLLKSLKEDKKQVIDITEEQVTNFAGNMLQVKGANDELFLVMSQAAHDCLTQSQISQINRHCKIISSSLATIEACGGGSARCMMAEVFLPKN